MTRLFQSLVTYGPFRFGGPGYDSQLLQIAADMDANMTGSVTWAVYTAKTAQEAVAAAIRANSEWPPTPTHGRVNGRRGTIRSDDRCAVGRR